jgi:hypothetical protein
MAFLALLTLKERDTAVKRILEDMNKIQEEWREIADVMKQEVVIMEEKSNRRFVVDLERRMIAKVMVKIIAIVTMSKTAMLKEMKDMAQMGDLQQEDKKSLKKDLLKKFK